ncbi:MAG TPA: SCO family protein [Vicinamibacterales bacterium]|nr:SCO family protein [Vicinamibacterales bacterium]
MRFYRGTRALTAAALVIVTAVMACSRARKYELRGQVLAVDQARGEITVKHEDIQGFMPGMTMPFRVADAAALTSAKPGDLIRATLVIEDAAGHLENITITGHAPLADVPPRPRIDLLQPGEPVPDVTLIDSAGAAHALSEWRGNALAVTFIYTRCPVPNFCPLMDRHFADAQRTMLSDPGFASQAHLLSISFDPAHDTPAVLAAHAKKVGADPRVWTLLTGDRRDVEAFASRFGVSIVPDEANAPEIVHNLRTAVIDPRGRLVKIFNGSEWTPGELLDALRASKDGSVVR